MNKYKNIIYRESRKIYQIKVVIAGKQIVKQSKDLEEALQIREDIYNKYNLNKSLLLSNELAINRRRNTTSLKRKKIKDIANWYNNIKSKEVGLQAQRRYSSIVEKIVGFLGNYGVTDITKANIQHFIFYLSERGIKGGTEGMAVSSIKIFILLLRQYYNYLIDDCGYVTLINPCLHLKYPKVTAKRRECLSDADINKIMLYFKEHHKNMLFLIKLYFETGCRRGELLGLTWRYVNFKNESIQIQKTLVYDGNNYRGYLKDTPKTAASERTLYLNKQDMSHLSFLYDYALKHDKDFSIDSYVFLNANRRPFSPKRVSDAFRDACVTMHIDKNVSLHSTRHTFATKLINSKVPLTIVKKIGGWSKSQTLLDIYAHANNDDEVKKAMQNTMLS